VLRVGTDFWRCKPSTLASNRAAFPAPREIRQEVFLGGASTLTLPPRRSWSHVPRPLLDMRWMGAGSIPLRLQAPMNTFYNSPHRFSRQTPRPFAWLVQLTGAAGDEPAVLGTCCSKNLGKPGQVEKSPPPGDPGSTRLHREGKVHEITNYCHVATRPDTYFVFCATPRVRPGDLPLRTGKHELVTQAKAWIHRQGFSEVARPANNT